jgi:hypothetical protein
MTGDATTWMNTVESGVADPSVSGAVVDVGPSGGTSTNGDTGERKGRRLRLPLLRRFVGRGREDGDRTEEAEDRGEGTGLNGHGHGHGVNGNGNGNGANTNRTGPVDGDPGRPTLFDELGNDGFRPVKAPPWEVVGVATVTGRSGPGR